MACHLGGTERRAGAELKGAEGAQAQRAWQVQSPREAERAEVRVGRRLELIPASHPPSWTLRGCRHPEPRPLPDWSSQSSQGARWLPHSTGLSGLRSAVPGRGEHGDPSRVGRAGVGESPQRGPCRGVLWEAGEGSKQEWDRPQSPRPGTEQPGEVGAEDHTWVIFNP